MPLLTALSVSLVFLSTPCAPTRNKQLCSSGQIIFLVLLLSRLEQFCSCDDVKEGLEICMISIAVSI